MAVTDPVAKPYNRMSMLIVPADTPGIEIVRNVGFLAEKQQVHAYLRFTDVRVPLDHMLGEPGQAFVVAQTRLGGGGCITPCARSDRPGGCWITSASAPFPARPRARSSRKSKWFGENR